MSCGAVALLFSDKDIYLEITNTLAQCKGLPFLFLNIVKHFEKRKYKITTYIK
jgi:hypothetical protein